MTASTEAAVTQNEFDGRETFTGRGGAGADAPMPVTWRALPPRLPTATPRRPPHAVGGARLPPRPWRGEGLPRPQRPANLAADLRTHCG